MQLIPNPPAVLITGASTGIGNACALRMAALGYRVYAGVRRSQDARDLEIASRQITPVQLDVCNPVQISSAADQIKRELGPEGTLLGIVNNAGIAVAGPLEFVPIGEFRKQLEVNVTGLLAVTQAFLPLLRKSHGRIVHISSNSGKVVTPFTGAYCASKFAVEAVTDALRMELLPAGVHVCAVLPGAIATPIWDKSSDHAERLLAGMPPEAHELYGQEFEALRQSVAETRARAISPEKVADAVEHALTSGSPKLRYVVGMDAKIQLWLAKILPVRMMDALIRGAMGMK